MTSLSHFYKLRSQFPGIASTGACLGLTCWVASHFISYLDQDRKGAELGTGSWKGQ